MQPTSRQAVKGEAAWPFQTPITLSAARCVLRYMILPFVLPLAGLTASGGLAVLLVLDAMAAVTIVTSLRRLWRQRHPRRWQYALVAATFAVMVALFSLNDAGLM